MPVVIVRTLTERKFDYVLFLQIRIVVEDSVLGRRAGTLGHLLSHEVEVPIFRRDSVLAHHGTSLGVGQTSLILGEEAFRNTFLDNNLHELRVVLEAILGNVLETIEDLLHFVFQDGLELAFGHTISVENDGVGIAAVDAVVVPQGAFDQAANLVHDFDLLTLTFLNKRHVLGDTFVHRGDETDG